jgi:hypothetical protein
MDTKMGGKIMVSDEDDESDFDSDDESEYGSEDSESSSPPQPINIIDDEDAVKIISVDIGDNELNNEIGNDDISEVLDEHQLQFGEENNIQVEKVESVTEPENVELREPTISTSKEIYRKMTPHALKTLVITKGLSTDPSKLKKNDLLKLLENEDE